MTNIISFQKPGITGLLQHFLQPLAVDIGSIHPADIFCPDLCRRAPPFSNADAKADEYRSSLSPSSASHFYPICRLLAVLYTLFYAAAKHPELSGSFDSRIFRLAFLAAAVIRLFYCRSVKRECLFLASRQQRRFAQNTLQQPDGACPVPPAISAAHALSRKQKLLCYFGLLFCWLFWFLYQFFPVF